MKERWRRRGFVGFEGFVGTEEEGKGKLKKRRMIEEKWIWLYWVC